MKFSTSVEYAIHSLVYLSKKNDSAPVILKNIAGAVKVPETYLRKVFQSLMHGNLIHSHRGAAGGVSLAREPEKISLKDIVFAIDGDMPLYTCLESRRNCPSGGDCTLHQIFQEARKKMLEVLESSTLRDLSDSPDILFPVET